jgi:hypothetical protein
MFRRVLERTFRLEGEIQILNYDPPSAAFQSLKMWSLNGGRAMPISVTIAVISAGGVMSNAADH